MNHGVLFVDENGIKKHSYDDWGLLFNPFQPPFPKPKTDFLETDGGNGSIDLTEAYGKILYKDTSFTMSFNCHDKIRYDKTLNKIASFIHGKRLKTFVYYDEDYYYDARISINKYASNKAMGEIVLSLEAHPFKLKEFVSVSRFEVTDKKIVVLKNDRMETVPRFKCNTDFTVIFNGNSYVINGDVIIPNIEFIEGDNILELRGNGVIEISYQEGKF